MCVAIDEAGLIVWPLTHTRKHNQCPCREREVEKSLAFAIRLDHTYVIRCTIPIHIYVCIYRYSRIELYI